MGKGSPSIKSQMISAHNGEFTDPFEPCPKFNIKPSLYPSKGRWSFVVNLKET